MSVTAHGKTTGEILICPRGARFSGVKSSNDPNAQADGETYATSLGKEKEPGRERDNYSRDGLLATDFSLESEY